MLFFYSTITLVFWFNPNKNCKQNAYKSYAFFLFLWYDISMKENIMSFKRLKLLGSGSMSDGYLIDDQKVILVGIREDAYSNYISLFNKLSMINREFSTIKYPKIHKIIEPCDEYPFGAMIEDYVSGFELRQKIGELTTDDKKLIGKNLAIFLNELHSIEIAQDKNQEIIINLSKFDRSVSILKDYVDDECMQKFNAIKNDYRKIMEDKAFCITHGDLNAGNIMVDEANQLTGLIDFGNMEFYIPEVEFAHMYTFDKTIYNSMVKNYNKKIKEKEVLLIELVMNIRHFKNIVNFEDKRNKSLENIQKLMLEYLGKKMI